jgi:hypothetical protein
MNNSDKAHSYAGRADATGRRDFLMKAALAGATVALSSVPLVGSQPQATPTTPGRGSPKLSGRRRLGSLEVSSVGLGVQNMSRKYETTVPYRPEMINIIRAAYDRGVTFFDTAEAYGPFECERILGESIASFLFVRPCFRNAVGVDHQDVAGGKPAFSDRAVPFLEQSQHGPGCREPLKIPIRPHKDWRIMPAIHIAQAPCPIVIDCEEHGRIVAGLRVPVEEVIDGAQQAGHILQR